MTIPLVMIHGYSDSAKGLAEWRNALVEYRNLDPKKVYLVNFQSLSNEVTIRDIAEGFDRVLRDEVKLGLKDGFDAFVHSTGMLVIRAWLSRFAPIDGRTNDRLAASRDQDRLFKLRHLIAIAPATNGSPVAHKGRSWFGAVAKGNKDFGPDFLESGHHVLAALELGSSFTWELAEKDMFGQPRFTKGVGSPFVFTICGDSGLESVANFATQLVGTKTGGSDGVVRWAGAALNSRRLVIDFTDAAELTEDYSTKNPILSVSEWSNQDNILILWPGVNHGTIMNPSEDLVRVVSAALDVSDDPSFVKWNKQTLKLAQQLRADSSAPRNWQQFVIRVIDEIGAGIDDWTLSLNVRMTNEEIDRQIPIDDLHPCQNDKSYRCLHLDLDQKGLMLSDANFRKQIASLRLRLFMSTNSEYIHYSPHPANGSTFSLDGVTGVSELSVDLTQYIRAKDGEFNLIMSYTTTFVEFRVNRNPTIGPNGRAKVCHSHEL